MPAQLSTKLTLDGTQHNNALRDATKELSKYKREVAESDKQLKMWKQQSQSATGSVRNFMNSLKTGNIDQMSIAVKGMASQILKFGGIAGGAMITMSAFNKTIEGSQDTIDEYGRIQASVTTVVDNFFSAISSGDFSAFINGLDSMISKARDAYDEMDKLWNMAQSFDVKNARQNTQFQKNLLEIRKLKGKNDAESKKQMANLIAANERIAKNQSADAKSLYNQTMKGLRKQVSRDSELDLKNITDDMIYGATEADINGRDKLLMKQHKKYIAEREALNRKADKKEGNLFMGRDGVEYQKRINALQKKYGESIVYNTLLRKYDDDELTEFNNKLKQGINYQNVAISNQSKMLRYTKETNVAAGSGKGGSNKGGVKNGSVFPEGSKGYLKYLKQQKELSIDFQTDPESIKKIKQEISEIQKQIDNLENPIHFTIADIVWPSASEIKGLNGFASRPELNNTKIPDIKLPSKEDTYNRIVDKIDKTIDMYDMGIIGSDKAKEFIKKFNDELQASGFNVVKIKIETEAQKSIKELQDNIGSIYEGFSGIDNIIGNINSLAESISNGANAWEIFMGVLQSGVGVIQSISSVLEAFNTIQELLGITSTATAEQTAAAGATEMSTAAGVTTAKSGEAIASATAEGAKMPFPLNLVAIAAGVAAVIAALGQITGAFAEGGIVGGNSIAGDRLLARVNSGEMILNGRQQNNLFDAINSGNLGNESYGGEVVFKIKGKNLEGVRRNYNDKMKKIR